MSNKTSRNSSTPWQRAPAQGRNNQQNTSLDFKKSELKFKQAQEKLQAAVQKYVKDYDSSSEEENDELQTANIIGSLLESYSQSPGGESNLSKTQEYFEDTLTSGAITCLICISSVKRIDSIWNCSECYCIFHLNCIQRWSKDTIVQQKQALEDPVVIRSNIKLLWGCPKCRHEYSPADIPIKYQCYCGKTVDPKFEPFLIPHSCGETCAKKLKPFCGHSCILLCHPGPCPPCPQTVTITCYCASQPPKVQRCSNKEWSCGSACNKLLSCKKHKCTQLCHPGDCVPCSKKSIQKCVCGSSNKLRDCSTPVWQCDKICCKPLECGHHNCTEVCHTGKCEPCILSKPRTCPCGKTFYNLPCTEDTPTCGDTCGKLLDCGTHTCHQRCHKEKCGACLEIVEKPCRCGLHMKEVQCQKPYFCETKCKQMKDCNKHLCNRKCCNGNCPQCEKPCGRTLSCGNHKCTSICHRGPCYPCNLTETISCRCGETKLTVPCGRKRKTRPPKCNKLCKIPPDCHHNKRENHLCHFNGCPPCKQVCNKERPSCPHKCPAFCHSAVLLKIENEKPTMPWEQTQPQFEMKALACPKCVVPVPIPCLGNHEISMWPCHIAKIASCGRPCGRLLLCGNHECSIMCHTVENAPDDQKAGTNCQICNSGCSKPRPNGCQHNCPKPCHSGLCPPCNQMLRIRCHCGLNQPYVRCSDWTSTEDKEALQTCGNQCPKIYECGHRCKSNCHSGKCPYPELCKKKVKITCDCKRIKKEFSCEMVKSNKAFVSCDDVCQQRKEEEKKLKDLENEKKKKEEEIMNMKELEKYKRKFEGKKRNKERRSYNNLEERSIFKKYLWYIVALFIGFIAVSFVFYFNGAF